MRLEDTSQPAETSLTGREEIIIPGGKTLKIRIVPGGEEILSARVPRGKTWKAQVVVSVIETPEV